MGVLPPEREGSPSAPRGGKLKSIAVKTSFVIVPVAVVLLVVFAVKFANRIPDPVPSTEKPGRIDVYAEPAQNAVENGEPLYRGPAGAEVRPLAEYAISAKVLGARINRRYGEGDGLFPIDLALAWGKVADSDYDDYLDYHFDNIWIYNQWLMYRVDPDRLPNGITQGYIVSHISNNHVFPANENVYDAVAHLRKNQEVLLAGFLVSAKEPNGRTMTSSMSRTDSDAGACECFYVTRVQVEGVVYE